MDFPLRELQLRMARAFTHPEGVKKWLASEAGEWAAAIETRPPLSVPARLEIYSDAYFFRICEYFDDEFGRLCRVVGKEVLHQIVRDYLDSYPSTYTSMSDIGGSLPAFLKEREGKYGPSWLSEMANMDWLANKAFWAENQPEFDRGVLSGLGEEDWPKVRLGIDSSVQLFESRYPVEQAWLIKDPHEPLPDFSQWTESRYYHLIYRKEWVNYHQDLPAEKYWSLKALQRGECLWSVGDSVHQRLGLPADSKLVSESIAEWFSEWIGEGIIRSLSLSDSA